MSRAKAWFVGAGPGAGDLLTVRGARAVAEADIVIWGRRLLMEEGVREHAREDAELMPWPPATMDDLLGAYDRAAAGDLVVARLVGGDPAVYVDMDEELDRVRKLGLPHEIVPGVGSLSAAAAALGRQLVRAGSDDAMLLAPARASVRELSKPGMSQAIYMAGENGEALQQDLLDAGHPPDTACAVAHRLSWPDERFVTCRLDELAEHLGDPDLGRQTLVLVAICTRHLQRPGAQE